MLDRAPRAEFERQYGLVLVIYFALLASIFVYLGIGFVLIRALPSRTTFESAGSVGIVFYGRAAALIGAIFWIRRSWIAPLSDSLPASGDILELISKYRIGHIVVFVLCEAITVLGLVLLFLIGSFTHLVYFAWLSLTMMVVCYPKRVE